MQALSRRQAVETLLAHRAKALVVTGLGSASYDVHSAGDRDENYYLWGAMGAAGLVGLGLAQAQPDRTIVVITGDGEALMGLGGLATIGISKPRNLVIVVLDNGHYGETGMQTSHTGFGLDLAKLASASGFIETATLTRIDEVASLALVLEAPAKGSRLFVLKIAADSPPRSLPVRDAVVIKNRFRAHLGFPPN